VLSQLDGAGHEVSHEPTDDQPDRVLVRIGDGATRVELDGTVPVLADLLGGAFMDVRRIGAEIEAGQR
jgi:hypothetical protein